MAVEDLKGCESDVEVWDEEQEPESLQDGVSTKYARDTFEFGEYENKKKEEQNVNWCHVLQNESSEGIQVWCDAEVEGEVWVEEGKEIEILIVIASGQH